MFRGSQSGVGQSKSQALHEARQVRLWMQEVGEMAGRGENNIPSNGCCNLNCALQVGKDSAGASRKTHLVCASFFFVPISLLIDSGFAVFFSVFELTRRTSSYLRDESVRMMRTLRGKDSERSQVPRLVRAMTLVTGGILAGLGYDITTRPFDQARRIVHAQRVTDPAHRTVRAGVQAIAKHMRNDGLFSFFRSVQPHESLRVPEQPASLFRRRLYSTLRFLGRMGPWGAGFLIWEAYGPGLAA